VTTQTTEKAFESYLEETLINKSGWRQGSNKDWDKQRALFPSEIVFFIKDSQPSLWQEMEKLHQDELPSKLIVTLCKELDSKGTIHVLRYGFKFFGKTFLLAYFKPSHGLNPDIIELYNKNRLCVTRQVPCHPETAERRILVPARRGMMLLNNTAIHEALMPRFLPLRRGRLSILLRMWMKFIWPRN
jgi:type I restriction enzyme R subunit